MHSKLFAIVVQAYLTFCFMGILAIFGSCNDTLVMVLPTKQVVGDEGATCHLTMLGYLGFL